jgi:hypothetical protein
MDTKLGSVRDFSLSWDEALSEEQFVELVGLERAAAKARNLAGDAERAYRDRLMEVARPLIDAKIAAIGARLEHWDSIDVEVSGAGFANPSPVLEISVSNSRESTAIAD